QSAVSRRRSGDISNDLQRLHKVLTKVQTVILRRDGISPWRRGNEFLHGTFLPPSPLPPSFSFSVSSCRPFCRHASSPFRLLFRAVSKQGSLGLLLLASLRESRRASFNEKLISRVKSSTASGEQDLFFFLFMLVLPARRLGLCALRLYSTFLFSCHLTSVSFFANTMRDFFFFSIRFHLTRRHFSSMLSSSATFSRVFIVYASYARLHPLLFS
ncbi:hypothetical protein ALC62_05113, partial [Cyphomyrmex costatus]